MMNFNPTGGVTPRQALSLALMSAICAPRDCSERTGAFLTVTAETELAESMVSVRSKPRSAMAGFRMQAEALG